MPQEKEEYSRNLWWCCYIFDRFNAVFNYRFVFIRHEDFNVDLPYGHLKLLQLVQLARSFENMLVSVYQPHNNAHRSEKSQEFRQKVFNTAEFQYQEFNFCDKDRSKPSRGAPIFKIASANATDTIAHDDYGNRIVEFLTRLINNTIIMIAQKAEYDESRIPNHVPENIALKAASNILWYFKQADEEFILQIPLITYCLTMSMACYLKRKIRVSLRNENGSENDENVFGYKFEDFMEVLKKIADKWWVIEGICNLVKDFVSKLDESTRHMKTTKRKTKSCINNTGPLKKRQLTASGQLSDDNSLQNPAGSMTPSRTPANTPLSTENTGLLYQPDIPSLARALDLGSTSVVDEEHGPPSTGASTKVPTQLDLEAELLTLGSLTSSLQIPPDSALDLYLGSMHTDMFDNDFFKDLPNFINFLP